MTSHTKTMLELGDITFLEIECSECNFTASYPIAKLAKLGPTCPQCNSRWFDAVANSYPFNSWKTYEYI